MTFDRKTVFARLAARISAGKKPRRQSLKPILPVAADIELESRLMLSASSDDEVADTGDAAAADPSGSTGDSNNADTGGDTVGNGDDTNAGGDTITDGDGGGTSTDDSGGDMPHTSPIITGETSFEIPDTSEDGAIVGTITAYDYDVGDSVTFSFSGGSLTDPSGAFSIDPTFGVITLVNSNLIGSQDETDDSPEGWSFSLSVVASDTQSDTADTTATVDIQVKKSAYTMSKPEQNGTYRTDAELKVEATRADSVRVRFTVQKKEGDSWAEVPNGVKEVSGKGTTANVNYGKGEAGEYRIKFEKQKGTGWEAIPIGDESSSDPEKRDWRYFKVVKPEGIEEGISEDPPPVDE